MLKVALTGSDNFGLYLLALIIPLIAQIYINVCHDKYRKIENKKKLLNKMLSNLTGQTLKKVELDTERDTYLDSSKALEYGIIDSIIE